MSAVFGCHSKAVISLIAIYCSLPRCHDCFIVAVMRIVNMLALFVLVAHWAGSIWYFLAITVDHPGAEIQTWIADSWQVETIDELEELPFSLKYTV